MKRRDAQRAAYRLRHLDENDLDARLAGFMDGYESGVVDSVRVPKIGDPIIFRPTTDAPERVVRPCTGKHREYWLRGYIVASCQKCIDTLEFLQEPSSAGPSDG